jgi:hypothetical protein
MPQPGMPGQYVRTCEYCEWLGPVHDVCEYGGFVTVQVPSKQLATSGPLVGTAPLVWVNVSSGRYGIFATRCDRRSIGFLD